VAALSYITSEQTVRQVAGAFPACARLLERWPNARLADRWSLQQLGPFAAQQGLDQQSFLNELSELAGVPVRAGASSRDARSPMPLIFTALIVGLSLGTAWGVGLLLRIALGGSHDVVPARSVHVHGLAQLWGWLAIFVFGVASHVLRQNTKRPSPAWLERAAAAFVVAAIVLFICSMLNAPAFFARPYIDILASILLMLGALCFAASALWSLIGRGQRPLLWHAFVLSMIAWLLSWSAADLWLRLRNSPTSELPGATRSLLIALPVFGFATNAIYGFGIRLIPGLLNLARVRPRCFVTAAVMHNVGVCMLLLPMREMHIAGAALMLGAAIAYLIGMDGLRSKPSRPIYGIDARGHILIRVAFFWLLCGLAMVLIEQLARTNLPHGFTSAWRHALTVGFITTMILGVGYRILPVFMRQPLASTRLMLISAGLIIIGNAGRVMLELLTASGWTWTYRAMGITGLLELTALLLFASNLAATARNRRRMYTGAEPMTSDTRVQEAVNVRPEIQVRLRELGVTMFDDAAFIAPSMTIGALALAWGMSPAQLARALSGKRAGAPVIFNDAPNDDASSTPNAHHAPA
jgi:hypothetical protein